MDRLELRCSECGETFVVAAPVERNDKLMIFSKWGASLDDWLNHHWEHIPHTIPLGEAFPLEDNESMKEPVTRENA